MEVDGASVHVRYEEGDPYVLIRDSLVATGTGLRRLGVRSTTLEDIFLEQETGE